MSSSQEDTVEQQVFALGWGSLALINAALANIDRRGPLPYFIASLFFGPLVTLVLAATRGDEKGHLRQIDLMTGRDTRRSREPGTPKAEA